MNQIIANELDISVELDGRAAAEQLLEHDLELEPRDVQS
jgi:hypothetical protein